MSLMLAEIQQQPAVLERTIKREGRRIARFAESLKKRRTRLIVLVARGSSDNAALFGRYLLEISTGIPVSLAAPAVHTLYRARLDLARRAGHRDFAIGRRHRHQHGFGELAARRGDYACDH